MRIRDTRVGRDCEVPLVPLVHCNMTRSYPLYYSQSLPVPVVLVIVTSFTPYPYFSTPPPIPLSTLGHI
jgi:hypothetical protein